MTDPDLCHLHLRPDCPDCAEDRAIDAYTVALIAETTAQQELVIAWEMAELEIDELLSRLGHNRKETT